MAMNVVLACGMVIVVIRSSICRSEVFKFAKSMKASSSGSQLCPDRMLVGVNSVGTASKGELTPWMSVKSGFIK